MPVSLERLARNQALFREVNERLLKLSDGFADGSMGSSASAAGWTV
jgi:hypothetical protein